MPALWLSSVLVTLVFLPNTAAFEWDDFTNNLATDLGPLIALFGEQVTKQFLSESLGIWDNIIFAVSPLGILTAVVSAIRVCGSPSLRAFIGRAQESPGIVEVELLSCTSETTSELWNKGGIARVFGKPQILEVVRTTGKNNETSMKLFDQACGRLKDDAGKEELGRGEPPSWILERDNGTSQFDTRGQISPNLSLNFGIKRQSEEFTYFAAVFGLALQIGVLIYAGLTAYRFPRQFLLNDKPIETYAFPLTFSGTLLVCCGMFLCAYVIEKQTDEKYYKRNHLVTSQLYWVQPGGQKIGDQIFEAFVGKSDDAEYIRSSRADRDRSWVDTILWTAVIMTTIGFVVQFIGLRGMHSSVTVAQLVSTMIMAVIRASLRTQRMDDNRDILALPENGPIIRKRVTGYELDFLALHLEDVSAIRICTQRLGKRLQGMLHDKDSGLLDKRLKFIGPSVDNGARALRTRMELASLTSGMVDHSWHSHPVKQMAMRLQSAIDGAIRVLQLPLPHGPADECIPLEYKWESKTGGKAHDSSFPLRLYKQDSAWKMDVLQLEALLGVWTWSLRKNTDCGNTISECEETKRMITLDSSGTGKDDELWYKIWIQRDLDLCKQSYKDTQAFGYQDATPSPHNMLVCSRNQILMMCAQDIFILFLAASLERVGSLSGKTTERKVVEGDSLRLENSWIEDMAKCFVASGIGSKEDAYMCVIPVLKLKHKMPGMNEGLQLAAKKGYKEETRVLAIKGANVNAKNEEQLSALHLAVISKHEDIVEILAEQEAHIDAIDGRGWSALHVAAERGYEEVVGVLVKKGADLHMDTKEGQSALHIAAAEGHEEVVRILVNKGADLNKKNTEGWSALHIAAEQGHAEVVRMLTREAEIPIGEGEDVNMKNKEGLTALHLAVIGKHSNTVKALVEAGANINATDGRGWSALHIAAAEGHEEVIRTLVNKGADLNKKNTEGWSALHIAADQGNEEAVEVLVEEAMLARKRVDIDQKDKEGWTALHLGVIKAHIRITEMLVKRGANIYAKNDQGWTTLHLAAERGLKDTVEVLVRMGVAVNTTMREGWTALHMAAAEGHEEIVRMLVKQGADLNKKNTEGWSTLHITAGRGHTEIVRILTKEAKILIGEGSDVNIKNKEGLPALHLAVIGKHSNTVEALVEAGANINATDGRGWNTLHVAAERGNQEVVKTLVNKGADLDVENTEGWSALHIAADQGNEGVVQLLVEQGADISKEDTEGWIPRKIAEKKGHNQVVKILQEAEIETERGKGASNQNDRYSNGLSMNNSHESSKQVGTIEIPARVFPRKIPVSRFHAEFEYGVQNTFTRNTIAIPCHHIRIGDILILQGRPCQVIRIATSSQTGQHRYLGVDLFTKALHEESSFISHPAPSVVIQSMLGPIFKQYRVLYIRDDGRVVAMTETGDIKQGLPVLDQSDLASRLAESFDNDKGSVRVLIIDDNDLEMVVDYKVVHGSRL